MIKSCISLLLACILMLGTGTTAYAQLPQEKILDFVSVISVNPDASIDVTENIVVFANSDKIIHGIIRWLPMSYVDSYGISRHVRYQVQQVLMNNQTSNYQTSIGDNQLLIYTGDKNTILTPGNYTYTIKYHVNNAVNFLRDGDEIYWNITGNGWKFNIEKAQATVELPPSAVISHYAAYTGAKSERGKDYSVSQPAANNITFATTRPLAPGEGFTIAAAFQKGIVQEPRWKEKLLGEIQRSDLIALLICSAVFIYYFVVWHAVGKDPGKGTIIPLFEPPEGLTPEAMRFIMRMRFDNKTYSAAIVNLAAIGYIGIKNENSEFELDRTPSFNKTLPSEERALADELFTSKAAFIISQDNRKVILKARSALRNSLISQYQDKYFITNNKYLPVGWILSAAACAAIIMLSNSPGLTGFMLFWLGIWIVICISVFWKIISNIRLAWLTHSLIPLFSVLIFVFILVPIFFGNDKGSSTQFLGDVSEFLSQIQGISWLSIAVLFLLAVLNFLFWDILRAPTHEGRQLMDKIEGFKLFFQTTEQYRLQQMSEPQTTLEMYEKYLPYAIALDMENEWSSRFNDILRQAGMEPESYHPSWYNGPSWTSRNIAALPVFLGAGLASSLAVASTSSSSSASGGGGFSGGGGGGGGGGGW